MPTMGVVAALHPRATIGTPEPPATRRKLRNIGVLLAHEVGVDTHPERGRYRSDDPERVLDDARAAASFGVAVRKPWEYNWMIGRDGSMFEQAGEYMGAHCLNFNPDSVGIIFLNAVGLPPTEAQIESWWFLRGHAVDIGVLAPDHEAWPHYRYRATSCCGVLANPPGARWAAPTGDRGARLGSLIDALTTPRLPEPVQPPPTPTEARKMLIIVGNKDNQSDPRRWVWDGGASLRLLRDENDYNTLVAYSQFGITKFHPDHATLAKPFWMTTAERSRYGQP